ncbi:MAG: 23S rRNA (guanosine(2251)-2'-O)-methyltransferase RlmB [Eggerthellaceae bacterium]|nr:23S rRNA (guanosine(2251)-2'-O)-methyltransferase RlmB [Eggerthellaceae bacterium]
MADYIEGKHPVIEALRVGIPLTQIMVADNLKRDGMLADIERKARRAEVPIKLVPRKKLDDVSSRGSHQGIIAIAREFDYASMRQVTEAANQQAADANGRALVVILDHITDAGNFGAIVRSAHTVGASGIIIPNKRSCQVTAATYKSSAGAIAHLPVSRVSNLANAMEALKKEGFWIAGASEHASDIIWNANLSGKIALVMGSENEGISRLVLEHCDFLVKLPQVGKVESLNVAQAATACMYEWLRQNWL